MIELKEDEKLECLGYGGLEIVQSKSLYRFTTDAVLLANFARVKKNSRVVELGTGSGVISLLVAKRCSPAKIVALEIQPQLAGMAQRSVLHNKLETIIEVLEGDILEADRLLGAGHFDSVVVNPPYRKLESGQRQEKEHLEICRHEVKVTLKQILHMSGKLLNCGGSLYMVHQAERLGEIVACGKENGLELKELTTVSAKKGGAPNLILLRLVKGGRVGVKWNAIHVFDENGNYIKQWQD